MGIIKTDEWLEEHFTNPFKLCELAVPEVDSRSFYYYVKRFGMYEPSEQTRDVVKKLKEQDVWNKVDRFYRLYKKKWSGPEVDIYIFPIDLHQSFFRERLKGRSGLAYKNKIFLFLTDEKDEKGWEALFIHEYHHAARMAKQKKEISEYTLLDSLMIEGLAEHAVLLYCGKKFTARWENDFSSEMLKYYWKHIYEPNVAANRESVLHDDLLLGRRRIPRMMGYAIGGKLVDGYLRNNSLSIKESFDIQAEKLLVNNHFLDE
ncbi:DUF2268 domain-containing putative Zn-dependent protease [Bacillus sp. FJAT-50079]|uniref:DUF2268 domain-containing protein n=1 Tax=Bacillus sp. FJAT-50079 TaxID=2833577 RepID=UPI001BCA295B|nr:DUF2268 domain-containing putative Zn-dependent protease [Bacillus sp. FJAT-50079]MBS4210642.1 hypothetical protein [Bacillus sp. FJAT-50079]